MGAVTVGEVKLTIAKLLELAYSTDKGATTKIILKKGSAKLTVDQDGNARLSSAAGNLTFSGSPALDMIGAKVKLLTVNFSNMDGMRVGYTATIQMKLASFTMVGSFDVEEMITACSGLLCRAARALQGRNRAVDKAVNNELQRMMER